MKQIDLHVHSTCSDGTLTPAQLVERGVQRGLSAFALTDHDTVAGLPEAFAAAEKAGMELVAGIEFSTVYHDGDLHILGLDLDYQNPTLLENLRMLQQEREDRNQQMIDKMAEDGIDISREQMVEMFGEQILTRAHFARYLAAKGYVRQMWDAFQTHIGDQCKYYIPRQKVSPFEMVSMIRDMGGIPVLAHPFQYHLTADERVSLIRSLKRAGLLGIEAIYSTHTGTQESELRSLARSFGLGISGGSDFHGANKPNIELGRGKGNLRIPYELLEQLREAREK